MLISSRTFQPDQVAYLNCSHFSSSIIRPIGRGLLTSRHFQGYFLSSPPLLLSWSKKPPSSLTCSALADVLFRLFSTVCPVQVVFELKSKHDSYLLNNDLPTVFHVTWRRTGVFAVFSKESHDLVRPHLSVLVS